MAINPDVLTYGYLNRWGVEMDISPWHFNQLAGQGQEAPLSEGGVNVFVKPDWKALGRGLGDAISDIAAKARFYPRPIYIHERLKFDTGRPWQAQSLATTYKHVQAIGRRATTVLEAAAPVVYTDEDGDSVLDTGTVTVVMATTPPATDQIQMFFQVTDGAPGAADQRYELDYRTVSVSGNTITITAHISYFVKPTLWLVPYIAPNWNPENKNVLDTTDAANYVTAVDVYRVWPDPSSAVNLLYDPLWVGCCSDDLSQYTTVAGQALIEDSRLGLLRFRELVCPSCRRYPYAYVDVYYYAGYPLTYWGEPDPELLRAVVRLANCNMPRDPNSFSNPILQLWQTDTLYMQDAKGNMVTSPFGSKVGEVTAWRIVSDYAIGNGGSL